MSVGDVHMYPSGQESGRMRRRGRSERRVAGCAVQRRASVVEKTVAGDGTATVTARWRDGRQPAAFPGTTRENGRYIVPSGGPARQMSGSCPSPHPPRVLVTGARTSEYRRHGRAASKKELQGSSSQHTTTRSSSRQSAVRNPQPRTCNSARSGGMASGRRLWGGSQIVREGAPK